MKHIALIVLAICILLPPALAGVSTYGEFKSQVIFKSLTEVDPDMEYDVDDVFTDDMEILVHVVYIDDVKKLEADGLKVDRLYSGNLKSDPESEFLRFFLFIDAHAQKGGVRVMLGIRNEVPNEIGSFRVGVEYTGNFKGQVCDSILSTQFESSSNQLSDTIRFILEMD